MSSGDAAQLMARVDSRAYAPAAPTDLPRLLAGMPAHGALALEQHLYTHGQAPEVVPARRRRESPLIAEVERSGLLGRGGAAFPLARKLRAVAAAGRRPVVVVNGAEGEPASMKDRTLLQSLPHLVLDGAEIAAQALGAGEVIVAVCRSFRGPAEHAAAAAAERRGLRREQAPVSVAVVPDHYLAGQESALVSCLNGGRAHPTFTPPLPFQQGVDRRPTLVANVETLAQLALVARHGAQWFRRLGTPSQPGSALVTLCGPVANPGVYEIEYGSSLRSLIDAAGGATGEVRAALFGGYGGAWVDGSLLATLALSDEHLAPHRAALGAGVVLLLSAQACPVTETARVARWLAGQSSGQCGPCVNGLPALAATLGELAEGAASRGALQRLSQLASLVHGRGACRHPDGAAGFVLSAAETFAGEFADHARHGRCEACGADPEMPLGASAGARARTSFGAQREAMRSR
jgi:NADH:ubiquinone oxidoreductase subunit F (NADH-binding)